MILFTPEFKKKFVVSSAVLTVVGTMSACQSLDIDAPSDTVQQGYVADEAAIAAVPVGSSREQVQLSLGTPSTINNIDGNDVFYYISQTRKRSVAFQKLRVVDQRVLAIYFGPDGTVSNIANYGLKDGKVFDFIKRVTPTGGKDLTFIGQILSGLGRGSGSPGPIRDNKGDIY